MNTNKFCLAFLSIVFSSQLLCETSLYLDLMKKTLTNIIYDKKENIVILEDSNKIWPSQAHTMIGLVGLNNIQYCMEDIIKNNIPGDVIETGAWRGGATIFMRAILKEYNITDRTVWVADSFQGLPVPDTKNHPDDPHLEQYKELAVSLEKVQDNFSRYDLLDNQVKFLKGWFKDTLPNAPINQLALLRMDGDYYESTMDALVNLYPKLSVGGWIIIDDYGCIPACARAVNDYRKMHNITSVIQSAGWTIRYWQKQ